ncbi:MAG: S41 family peptidase [Eubacteriales bacterium]
MMEKNFFKGLITGIVIMFAVGLIYIGADQFLTSNNLRNNDKNENLVEEAEINDKISKIVNYLNVLYYEDLDLDEEDLIEYAYEGIVSSIGDPYTEYFTEKELESFMEESEGIYSGIGAYVSFDEKTEEFVLIPFVGSPSEQAGVKPGDVLLEVDGEEIHNKTLEGAVDLVKGDEGTKVVLTVYRESKDEDSLDTEKEILEIDVIRGKIEVPTIAHEMLEEKIGYIAINQFEEVTVDQFKNALTELENQGQKGLIIDVRNNPGGLLSVVKDIADELLPEGIIVYTEDKYGNREELLSNDDANFTKPLVILINDYSASASEILAGAIKDHGIGTLVGTTTYGKGLVQSLVELGDGSAIKLTISKYFTPNGEYIHGKGIAPDVEVVLPDELKYSYNIEKEEDVQLEKAIEIINEETK